MKKATKIILALSLVIGMSISVSAQENKTTKKTKLSVEIDPATFAFKGYGVHLRIQPKNSEHFLVGAGVYAMDFPNLIVDINPENKNKGWNVRLNSGVGIFGEYHFSEVNRKWFVGGQFSVQEYKIENELTEGSEKFSNLVLMAYGGYTWQPFDFNFYLKPWAGIGYTSKISGDNKLRNMEYDILPVIMFATLHIGYTF